MKILEGKEKDWEQCKEINSKDMYSRYAIEFMVRWAELLEKKIEENPDISAEDAIRKYADGTSVKADIDGITGFQFGCVVNLLYKFWIFGKELNAWHNSKYGYEGEGTVNPAMMLLKER